MRSAILLGTQWKGDSEQVDHHGSSTSHFTRLPLDIVHLILEPQYVILMERRKHKLLTKGKLQLSAIHNDRVENALSIYRGLCIALLTTDTFFYRLALGRQKTKASRPARTISYLTGNASILCASRAIWDDLDA